MALALLATACTGPVSQPTQPPPPTLSGPPASIPTDRILAELELEALAGAAGRLRGLEFLEPVTVQIVDDAAFRARVAELTAAPLEITPAVQSRWLRLLGVLPEGADTYSAESRLAQTAVAFHDPEESRILVRAGAGIDPYVESAVVHEFVHALQHQHFGVPDTELLDGDAGYVYTALVEGDAQRIARFFIGELTLPEEGAFEAGWFAASEDSIAVRDGTPGYVLDSLRLPAGEGLRFLQSQSNAAVDRLFADIPGLSTLPRTSESVIDPNADPAEPEIDLPPVMVLPYQPLPIEGTLGAGRLRILLGSVLDADVVREAVEGWGADRLDILVSPGDVLVAYAFAGDRVEDAGEMAVAFELFLASSLAPGAYGSVRIAENRVLVLAASDRGVRERLDELFAGFGDEIFTIGRS
jgi:hypothetical protein